MAVVIQREPDRRKGGRRPKKGRSSDPFWQKIKPVVWLLTVFIILQAGFVLYYTRELAQETELSTRNFYGVLRVWEINDELPNLIANQLTHGKTAHGFQFVDESLRALPTAYFTPESGVGLTILNHTAKPGPMRIGALGLGIGVVSTYGEEGDVYRFYEVNPEVISVAEGEGGFFTYLQDSNAEIEVVEGDARVSLEKELAEGGSQEYDILILDVFSGDTMPLHLLTREAFQVYLDHLAEDGVIAINISNRLFNLYYPIYLLADEFGLQTARIESPGDGLQSYDSAWMMLTKNETFLARPPIQQRTLERPNIPDNFRLWTDDFSNLFQILK